MAAIGAALVRELLDDRLSNPEQVYSSLGVPVLASFEKEKT
jgi:capsular polysaccharide biosynthesis protein